MNCETLQTKRVFGLSTITKACMVAPAFALLVGMTTSPAVAGQVTPPPNTIPPPPGNTAFLLGHGVGTQGYVCLPSDTGTSWSVNPSRPQATLSITLFGTFSQQIITHFLSPDPAIAPASPVQAGCILDTASGEIDCPTWQSSFDTSVVWGTKIASVNAGGTDTSCPAAAGTAIPCLLLQALSTKSGPNGFGILTNTTYIQRLNTAGGVAPTVSCSAGEQALVPYTADYYFYTAQR